MGFINPIRKNINNKIDNVNLAQSTIKTIRKERCDKKQTTKFPVDQAFAIKLKSAFQQHKRVCIEKGIPVITQTEYNTKLLELGLSKPEIIDFTFFYKDTKQYMQTKLLKSKYQSYISGPFGLAVQYNLSERKVVFFIIKSALAYIEKGGEYEVL